jgi:hypothetical protein
MNFLDTLEKPKKINLHNLKIQMEQMHSPNTIKTDNLNSVQYFENHTKPLVPKTNRKIKHLL